MNIISIPVPNGRWACVSYVVRCGSMHDPQHLPGLTHLTEHFLARKAQKTSSPLSLEAQLITIGGYFDAYTTIDKTVFTFLIPAEKLSEGVSLAMSLSEPLVISEEDWTNELRVVYLQMLDKYRAFDLNRHLRKLVWGSRSKQARAIIGTPAFLRRVRLQDITRHTERYYTPNNSFILCLAPTLQSESNRHFATSSSVSTIPSEVKPTASFVKRQNGGLVHVSLHWLIDELPSEILFLQVILKTIEQILIEQLRHKTGLVENVGVSYLPEPAGMNITTYTRARLLDTLLWFVLDTLRSFGRGDEWVPLAKGVANHYLMWQKSQPSLETIAEGIIRYGISDYEFENDLLELEACSRGEPYAVAKIIDWIKHWLGRGVLYGIFWGDIPEEQETFARERVGSWTVNYLSSL